MLDIRYSYRKKYIQFNQAKSCLFCAGTNYISALSNLTMIGENIFWANKLRCLKCREIQYCDNEHQYKTRVHFVHGNSLHSDT